MRTASLAWLAVLLTALLGASAWLALDRYGWLAEPEAPGWSWSNGLVTVPRGQVMILRSARERVPDGRYWFGPKTTQPDLQGNPQAPGSEAPHVFVGVQMRNPDGESWAPPQFQFWPLRQLGAMTQKEWLSEIRLVREQQPDGSHRTLLVASYGHESGATVEYVHEPDPEAARASPLGWFRTVRKGPGQPPDVLFAYDGGIVQPN